MAKGKSKAAKPAKKTRKPAPKKAPKPAPKKATAKAPPKAAAPAKKKAAKAKAPRKPEKKPARKALAVKAAKSKTSARTLPKVKVKARQRKGQTKVSVMREAPARKKTGLSKDDLDYFKRVLNEKRGRIVEKARDTLNEGMKLDEADLPDEYDMASSEYLQYFTLRLRGRERYFLDKIERALQRIDEGSFGICEVCGDDIGMARLMARPETTLCIRCKETQEREERQFSE
jgi:DnaK suppressor protein